MVMGASAAGCCCNHGACCNGEICSQVTADACFASGGSFFGLGSSCSPNPCSEIGGACCFEGLCSEGTQEACDSTGGIYQGDGTSCVLGMCSSTGCDNECCGYQPFGGPDGYYTTRVDSSCPPYPDAAFSGPTKSCARFRHLTANEATCPDAYPGCTGSQVGEWNAPSGFPCDTNEISCSDGIICDGLPVPCGTGAPPWIINTQTLSEEALCGCCRRETTHTTSYAFNHYFYPCGDCTADFGNSTQTTDTTSIIHYDYSLPSPYVAYVECFGGMDSACDGSYGCFCEPTPGPCTWSRTCHQDYVVDDLGTGCMLWPACPPLTCNCPEVCGCYGCPYGTPVCTPSDCAYGQDCYVYTDLGGGDHCERGYGSCSTGNVCEDEACST
jgi:hypothetical protein